MKLRGTKDLSIAAVGKYGALQEFSFFDKVGHGARALWAGVSRAGDEGRPWFPNRVWDTQLPLRSHVAMVHQRRSWGLPPRVTP